MFLFDPSENIKKPTVCFTVCFFVVCQCERYRNVVKLSCRSLLFTKYKTFLKNKKWSGTSFHTTFFASVLNKNVSLVIIY